MSTAQEESSATSSPYVTTHCKICKAGWTRTDAKGGMVTVCMLDREPVWADMVDCDRFERQNPPRR